MFRACCSCCSSGRGDEVDGPTASSALLSATKGSETWPVQSAPLRSSEIARAIERTVAIWQPSTRTFLTAAPDSDILTSSSTFVASSNTFILGTSATPGWFTLRTKESARYLTAATSGAKSVSRATWRVALLAGAPSDAARFQLRGLGNSLFAIGTVHSWGASGGGTDMLCVAPGGGVGRCIKKNVPGAAFTLLLLP